MGIIYKNGVQYGGTVDAANMHVDIGSSTLNLQTAIQNITGRVAPIESNPTTNAYEIGDLLVFNGMLYEATAAISAGDTLVIGTNIASTTVSQNKIGYNDIVNNVITDSATKVASAATVKAVNDALSSFTDGFAFRLLASKDYKATSTNYEYITSFTIPTGCTYLVRGTAVYTAGAPIGVAFCNSSSACSASTIIYLHETTTSLPSGNTPTFIFINGTYYMWVKRASVPGSNNSHYVYGCRIYG